MDQATINLLGGAVMAALGWFARTLWDRQEAHGRELSDFRVKVASEYVPNTKLDQSLTEIKGDIRYIRDQIDRVPPPHRRAGDPP